MAHRCTPPLPSGAGVGVGVRVGAGVHAVDCTTTLLMKRALPNRDPALPGQAVRRGAWW